MITALDLTSATTFLLLYILQIGIKDFTLFEIFYTILYLIGYTSMLDAPHNKASTVIFFSSATIGLLRNFAVFFKHTCCLKIKYI